MSASEPGKLVKLTGTIQNYKATRTEASFVFTQSDRNSMGVVAIAAGIAGLSGPAIATAAHAASTEEEADYLEFELDGELVKGWVWRSPFKEGDVVGVAAEWRDGHYEVAGISRPLDRTIALYPHCSRGRSKHVKNAVKWWFLGATFMNLLIFLFAVLTTSAGRSVLHGFLEVGVYMMLGVYVFFGLMTFSLARKWMPFVHLSEKVFTTLGWSNPGNIDLAKSSKAQRKPEDPGEFGTFYFRY